ncbi:ComF family protein [Leucobacter sp. CSA2]|uniref:ComF family protein n=1 Tax=Leucobacter edaphi TaxID=2796472 RepID=A0A934UY55_9MICO|nr:phosphoribosyltransferase family protein [Leucobacter edaphi]MBK0422406.1 ComF family protein [Leucobacter edaphi]
MSRGSPHPRRSDAAIRQRARPRSAAARALREVGADLAAILWPGACVGCGFPDRELCVSCRAELRLAGERPLALPGAEPPCYAAGSYSGALRGALLALKYGGRTRLAGELGASLGPSLLAAAQHCRGPHAPVIVTVPSRAAHARQRGCHPVRLLLRSALRAVRLPALRVDALRVTRGRVPQRGLSRAEREKNAALIAVRHGRGGVLRGRSVIIVDDVRTTGATSNAAARAVEAAGAHVAAIAVLCAVPEQRPR